MSYQSTHIQIMDMTFSKDVSIAEFEQWLAEVENFLHHQQNFALVMQSLDGTTFPEEYRQVQAAWYKKNKVKFFKYCVGLVRIALDDADQQRLNSPALHVAWRVPYYVTLDRCDALQWAVQRWICKT
ncbi:hypothetical protein [Acinetobacter bereziniae]|uniref:hypothetical protein n=1 Tax=Acinetobacter bereziniae TaxID=106648 RepID=UPI0021CF1330|nr:hypothetical protein [Acinetobacter bereziniae]MCU4474389.1 hypothetical protein [Acinetobacter bereziniae]